MGPVLQQEEARVPGEKPAMLVRVKLHNTFVTCYQGNFCIGDSMVWSAIWKKTRASEFFNHYQNSRKDERYLKALKNSEVRVLLNCTRNHAVTN